MNLQDVPNILVTCYGGSHAYGTNTPTSDVDIRGIFCAEKASILTPFYPVREATLQDQEDGKVYELTNFMKLYKTSHLPKQVDLKHATKVLMQAQQLIWDK